jgi:hypothetical protein
MRLPLPLLLAGSFCLLGATATLAQAGSVVSPAFSTIDRVVVGNASGTPMGGSPPGYDVSVRDINNFPVANARVVLEFGATGIRLYAAQNAGTTLDCVQRTLSRMTNAVGTVNFAARIGRFDNTNSIRVSADGVLLGFVPGRSTDIDGAGGQTSLSDFVLFSYNYGTPAQETDYDLNGMTGLGDFILFTSEYNLPPQPYCP